jgi:P-type conjugative transfer protein VirB9
VIAKGPPTLVDRMLLLWAVILASLILPARAELIATPLRGDSRLVQFVHDQDNTYLVLTKPKAVTHLQFAADEVIQSVAAGDTANWELTPTKNRRNLFIKPKFDEQETSMTVLTDLRTYQFVLRSTGDGKKWYQRVNWLYGSELVMNIDAAASDSAPASSSAIPASQPASAEIRAVGDPAANAVGLRPDSLRFTYEITGDAPFKPTVVFDDGRFMYFRMPPALQELPALFAVIEGKDFSLVNFEIKGEYIVAQRLLEEAVLKLGRAEVRVKFAAPKRSFFGFQMDRD